MLDEDERKELFRACLPVITDIIDDPEFTQDTLEDEDEHGRNAWISDMDTVSCYNKGMTKMVIRIDGAYDDYVLKIPIRSCEDEEYTTAFSEIENKGDEAWEMACDLAKGEGVVLNKWDYCARECVMTRLAEVCGVGDMVCGTHLLGYLYDPDMIKVPIYYSRACDERFDSMYVYNEAKQWCEEHEQDFLDITKCADKDIIEATRRLDMECSDVYYLLCAQYGMDETEAFVRMCLKYGIADLHDNNIMYDKDLYLKVVDMSGFSY